MNIAIGQWILQYFNETFHLGKQTYLVGAAGVSALGSGFGFAFTSIRTIKPFSLRLYSLNFLPSSNILP